MPDTCFRPAPAPAASNREAGSATAGRRRLGVLDAERCADQVIDEIHLRAGHIGNRDIVDGDAGTVAHDDDIAALRRLDQIELVLEAGAPPPSTLTRSTGRLGSLPAISASRLAARSVIVTLVGAVLVGAVMVSVMAPFRSLFGPGSSASRAGRTTGIQALPCCSSIYIGASAWLSNIGRGIDDNPLTDQHGAWAACNTKRRFGPPVRESWRPGL